MTGRCCTRERSRSERGTGRQADRDRNRTLKHNGIFRFLGLLNCERVVVTSPEALAEVLTRMDDFIQPIHLSFMAKQILGPGIVLVNGEEHKRQRRLLLPSFAMKHIRAQQTIYWAKAVEATEKLMDHVRATASPATGKHQSDKLEIGELASMAALDVISAAALGRDFGAIADPNSALIRHYRMVFEPTRWFQILCCLKFAIPERIIDSLPMRHNTDVQTATRAMRDVCRDTVREKRARLARGELHDSDIVSALLRDRNKELEDDDLVTQMMTMLGAGHETVSVAITWGVYEMCRRPALQAQIRAEIRARLPTPAAGAEAPAASRLELDEMPLLNAFCAEVLRYWPPIPMIVRTAVVDTHIQGVFVPASTKIVLPIAGINRDARIWGPDADRFDIGRWYDEQTGRYDSTGGLRSKYGLMSFIHGPRDCMGRNFAKAEMACMLACWIGRFEFSLNDAADMDEKNVPLSGGAFSSKPLKGIWVRAKQVPGW